MDLWNSNRLRVTWMNLRDHWLAPAVVCGHYRSRDHGQPRDEHMYYLHLFGRGLQVKWRPDGKRDGPKNIFTPPLDGN